MMIERIAVLRDMAAVLGAAIALGLGYNAVSPLRVQAPRTGTPPMPATGSAAGAYSNETVALHAQPPVPTPAISAAGNNPVRNETLAIAVLPSNAPAPGPAPAAGPAAPAGPFGKMPPTMTWPQVKAALARNELVLVDSRETSAFEAGHIPGAISFPAKSVREKIAEFIGKVPKKTPIVLYCGSAQCPLSRHLAQILAEQYGYLDVRDMPGGYAEWRIAETQPPLAVGNKP